MRKTPNKNRFEKEQKLNIQIQSREVPERTNGYHRVFAGQPFCWLIYYMRVWREGTLRRSARKRDGSQFRGPKSVWTCGTEECPRGSTLEA